LNLDFKFDEPGYLDALLKDLSSLQAKGYLTTVTDKVMKKSSITICATGAYPAADVLALNPRYVFLDAPLGNLSSGPVEWSALTSPLGSYSTLKNACTDYE
jgi:hypothetical protein